MAATRFEGIIPPVSTIFTEAGAFDPKGQALVIEKLVTAGVDGLFICGTGGEFSQMTTAERKTVAEFAMKQAAGRAKMLIGVGSNNPREAIELAVHAEAIGADGIVVVNPSYWKVTEPRLLKYFTDIAAATKLPVLLYNIPFLTGQDLTPAFVKSVVEVASNVVGIKETVDSIGHIREMINVVGAVRPDFQVLAGYDDHLLTTLMLGGAGAISASGNFAPELSIGIYKAFRAGDFAKAVELHSRLIRLPSMYGLDTPFVNVVKEAMRLTGLDISTYCLPPAGPLAADKLARLADLLKQAGLVK